MVLKLQHACELKPLIQNVYCGGKTRKVVWQTPSGVKCIGRIQVAQKEHRRLKSVHQIQKHVQGVSRNAGGGEYMGKFSAQETPTLLCKCWAKRNTEETTAKEVKGGRIDRGCACRSIRDFCF